MSTTRVIDIVIDDSIARRQIGALDALLRNLGSGSAPGLNSLQQQLAALMAQLRGISGAGGSGGPFGGANNSALRMAGAVAAGTAAVMGLTAAFGGLSGAVRSLMDASDAAGLMNAKLAIAYDQTTALAKANEDVRKIAQATRSELGATADLYANIARNAAQMGATQAQVAAATTTFAMSLKVAGAGAQQASSAILQLSQAMGSGVLSGDEFKSISEINPIFLDMLAKSMGVARGELKKLGSESKITSKIIKEALTDPKIIEEIEAKFGKIPVTFADIKTAIGNTMLDVGGAIRDGLNIEDSLAVMFAKISEFGSNMRPTFEKIGQALRTLWDGIGPAITAILKGIGGALMFLVNNMDAVVRITKVAVVTFAAFKAAMFVSTIWAKVASLVALERALGAANVMTALYGVTVKAVTGVVNTFTAALLANPFTAIITAATVAIALLYQFSDRISAGTSGLATLADMANVIGEDIANVWSKISEGFSEAMDLVGAALGPVGDWFAKVFGDIEISWFGLLKVGATVIDGVITFLRLGANVAGAVFSNIPSIVGNALVSVANMVIGGIQSMIDAVASGLNSIIALANKIPGVQIGAVQGFQLQKIAPVGPGLGAVVGGAVAGMKPTTGASDYVKGVGQRADQRAHQRGLDKIMNGAWPGGGAAASVGAAAAASPAGKGKDSGGKSDAEKMADKVKDFWAELEKAKNAAGLVGIELDKHTKSLELSKIVSRAITDDEKTRLVTLLQETATRKAIGDLQKASAKTGLDISMAEKEASLLKKMGEKEASAEMDIQRKIAEKIFEDKREGAKVEGDLYKAALATYETDLRRLAAINGQNDKLREQARLLDDQRKRGLELINDYGRQKNPAEYAMSDKLKRDADIRAAVKPAEIGTEAWAKKVQDALQGSADEYRATMLDVARQFDDRIMTAVDKIRDGLSAIFGEKAGKGISGMIGAISKITEWTKADKDQKGAIMKAFGESSDSPFARVTSGLGDLSRTMGSLFKPDGAAGKLFAGLGKAFENASGGAAIGGQIGAFGDMLGIKGFSGGAQIGGMIGGLTGNPLIAAAASVVGGLIGSIFYKPKHGSATVTGGGPGDVSIFGNDSNSRDAAGGAAGNLQARLLDIADKLGGTVGAFDLMIGQHNGKWRVRDTSTGWNGKGGMNFKGDSAVGLHDFGDDADAAIAYAISNAIKDGAIKNISDFAQKALNKLGAEAAISLVDAFSAITDELLALADPMAAAIKKVNDPLDKLKKQMVDIGAASTDLAKLEEYRSKKLEQALNEQLSPFNDVRKMLTGEGSGVTALNRLYSKQAEFATFESKIASGQSVDKAAFASLAQEIFGLNQSVYGSATMQSQALNARLLAATDDAIGNTQAQFDAQTKATIEQTQAITDNQALQLDVAREQLATLKAIQEALAGVGNAFGGSINGLYVGGAV